ncbi:hypothetical protein [Klebsiella aerogenes]|uniref:hypothetical protein n=1 Tax=Klebsiella aerogenes TaxID=548 RepID=UPI003B7E1CBB
MRLTAEQTAEIVHLKRSGVGYRAIASKMGFMSNSIGSSGQLTELFASQVYCFFYTPYHSAQKTKEFIPLKTKPEALHEAMI